MDSVVRPNLNTKMNDFIFNNLILTFVIRIVNSGELYFVVK